MPTFRRIRRTVAAVLLVVYLPGCHHYVTPKGMTPEAYIATKHPKRVRLTLTDSSRVVLQKPLATTDSVRGLVEVWGGWDLGNRDSTVAVPLNRVARFEVYEVDAAPTAVGLSVLFVVVIAAGVLIGCAATQCVQL